jgi:NIL domain
MNCIRGGSRYSNYFWLRSAIASQGNNQHIAIDIHIPQHLHQEPVLATLIGGYNLVVNVRAAMLDRKATGGGWFNLSLEGNLPQIEMALDYLRSLDIEIFTAHQ